MVNINSFTQWALEVCCTYEEIHIMIALCKSLCDCGTPDTTDEENKTLMVPVGPSVDDEEYNMHHSGGRGLAVFFGFSLYEQGWQNPRPFVEEEIKLMKKAYEALGFEKISRHLNLTSAVIKTEIKKLQERDYKDDDCLWISISSHGSQDGCFATYDGVFSIKDVVNSFTSDNVKSLAGKPKIFTIQCCRGTNFDNGIQLRQVRTNAYTQSDASEVVDGHYASYTLPTMADLLIAYSTVEGYASYHGPRTPFFYYLSKVLARNKRETEDLVSLVITAYCELAENYSPTVFKGKKLMPSLTTTLTRKVYFHRQCRTRQGKTRPPHTENPLSPDSRTYTGNVVNP